MSKDFIVEHEGNFCFFYYSSVLADDPNEYHYRYLRGNFHLEPIIFT